MTELAKYIFDHYPNLLTTEERLARKHLIGLQKLKDEDSESRRRFWLSTDENVLILLENGSEEFFRKTVERILRDYPNEVFLNKCPKCNALTKTPKAKQCPKCYFSWHGSE